MITPSLLTDAKSLLNACRARGMRLATAESCTGGLIIATLTAIAASSDVVNCGFVTYSNQAKHEVLGVPTALIVRLGAVSDEVAHSMAEGALARSNADLAVSVTGVAGPDGASVEKPVGLVCFGLARRGRAVAGDRQIFPGNRTAIRAAAVAHAFVMIRAGL